MKLLINIKTKKNELEQKIRECVGTLINFSNKNEITFEIEPVPELNNEYREFLREGENVWEAKYGIYRVFLLFK